MYAGLTVWPSFSDKYRDLLALMSTSRCSKPTLRIGLALQRRFRDVLWIFNGKLKKRYLVRFVLRRQFDLHWMLAASFG